MSIHEECGVFGADSLGYLPVEKLEEMIGSRGCCSACFDGSCPTAVPSDTRKNRFERKLSEKRKEESCETDLRQGSRSITTQR